MTVDLVEKSKNKLITSPMPSLLHACGVTVNGPSRISSRDGTVAWSSGTFVTIQETPDFMNLSQIHTKVNFGESPYLWTINLNRLENTVD